MGLDVIIGLVTIFAAIVGIGVALFRLTGKLGDEIKSARDELRGDIKGVRDELRDEIKGVRGEMATGRDELRGEIRGVRAELGGRIDAVAAELAKTRIAVARLEGSVLGVPLPDTGTDPA
ncbi:MAG: hypothetical protein OXN85_03510 [Gemmatimonadetes bacterium]|nr:hypothetical protein [Candidatus Palauibacter australiensis]